MAIGVQSFRLIDDTLARKLGEVWDEIADDYIAEVVRRVEAGEGADKVIGELSLDPIIKKNRGLIRSLSKTALLFGAAQAGPLDDDRVEQIIASSPLFDNAVKQFEGMIKSAEAFLKKRTVEVIQAAERKTLEDADRKVRRKQIIPVGLTEFANAGIRPAGFSSIQLASTLHSSRLGVYGYTIEAEIDDLQFYVINEVLDSLTCPVCRFMNNKVFPTEMAKQKITQLLAEDSADISRSLNPWPDQSAAGIERLQGLNTTELIDNGIIMPPFHPYCRGVIQRTERKIRAPTRPSRPVSDIERNAAHLKIPIPETIGQAEESTSTGFRTAIDLILGTGFLNSFD